MMMPIAPPGVPILGAGRHAVPDHGACLMEYVALLAGEPFNAYPRCTHPALAELARLVNDSVSDAGRGRLIRLAPDLVCTRGGAQVDAIVVAGCLRLGLRLRSDDQQRRALDEAMREVARLTAVTRSGRRRSPTPPAGGSDRSALPGVERAFRHGTGGVFEMPVPFRDRMLVELLTDTVWRCRRLERDPAAV